MLEFKANEIFKDVPGDEKKVIMTIPEPIMKKQGWSEGTKIKVKWGDQGTIIIEEIEDNE